MLKSKKLRLTAYLLIAPACLPYYAFAKAQQGYEFNTGFLFGSTENIDLTRFNNSAIDEGVYSVDVYTNDQWRGRYDIKVSKQEDGNLGVCYTSKMLNDFGINADLLNAKLSRESEFCGALSQWNNDKNIKDTFSPSALKLSIAVPQLYLLSRSSSYVSPEFWDTGIPAINLNYVGNYYNSHYSDKQIEDTQSLYLSLNSGLSFDGWLLKHSGNMTWQNTDKTRWNNTQTYLQRAISSIKSNIVVGQFYTEGTLFDSIKLKGAKLTTDDNMYPDGEASYAPEINGVAMSNALVTVRQNGNIVYQTSVTPGPFSIKDISSVSYGGDLDVTVKEADGSENNFTVPYASISQLLRPGFVHYQIAAGKADLDSLTNRPNILQANIQRGLNNTFTLYSGVTIFDDYRAYLLGTGINTGIGALGLDITYAQTSLDTWKNSHSYRLSFNRQISETKTNLILSASHSASEDYYDTNEALQFVDNYKRNIKSNNLTQKNSLSMMINQTLPESYGSFYLTGQIYSYWGNSRKTKQFQQTYNNRIGALSYGLAYMRIYSENVHNANQYKTDNRFSISFNYPLGSSDKRATMTSNTLFNNSHFGSAQVGLNGAFDQNGLATYGINSSVEPGSKKSIALNTNYRSSLANVNANFSQGERYRQFGAGTSGSVVMHEGGITFTPNTSNTMILIEAKDAKGAIIPGSQGARIDSNGYAIASYARPYRANTILIDPKGSNEDIIFTNTSTQIVPYEGSITKVKFETKIEKTRVFNIINGEGKPLSFGQDVTNEDGDSIGVVGQGGQVFIYDDKATKAIINGLKTKCSFTLDDNETNEKVCL